MQIIGKPHEHDILVLDTCCIWVKSPTSPVVEIQNLPNDFLKDISDALLIEPRNTRNTSATSIAVSLSQRGLNVVPVNNLFDMILYKLNHRNSTVLIVRTPIPNTIEKPVLIYLKHGIVAAVFFVFRDYVLKMFSLNDSALQNNIS